MISTDRAFLVFACEVARRFGGTVLFGRTLRMEEAAEHVLHPDVELVELPYYEDLRHLGKVLRGLVGTVRAMRRGLSKVELVWIFGPHPLSIVFATLALARRKRVVLGVRQDTMAYYRARLPEARWRPALAVVWVVDRLFRALARRVGVTVVAVGVPREYVGSELVLPMVVSLVSAKDVLAAPPEKDWSGTIELLSVGRIDAEKNPSLLVELLKRLELDEPGRYRFTWVGRGSLETEVREQFEASGLGQQLELAGYVPYGDELLSFYRRAHVFVHVSLTEGVPQVLVEALASGLPVVATDVGGVHSLLADGAAGLLVPPKAIEPLVDAVQSLATRPELRDRLSERGLEIARTRTLEAESERVAAFLSRRLESRR